MHRRRSEKGVWEFTYLVSLKSRRVSVVPSSSCEDARSRLLKGSTEGGTAAFKKNVGAEDSFTKGSGGHLLFCQAVKEQAGKIDDLFDAMRWFGSLNDCSGACGLRLGRVACLRYCVCRRL